MFFYISLYLYSINIKKFHDKKMNDKLSFYYKETEGLLSLSVFFSISVIIPSVPIVIILCILDKCLSGISVIRIHPA